MSDPPTAPTPIDVPSSGMTASPTGQDDDTTTAPPNGDGLSLRDSAQLLAGGLALAGTLIGLSAEGVATVSGLRADLQQALRDLGVARVDQLTERLLNEILDAVFDGDPPPQGQDTELPQDWLERLPEALQQALDEYTARRDNDVTVVLPDRVTVDLSDRSIRRLVETARGGDNGTALSADVRRLSRLVERVLRESGRPMIRLRRQGPQPTTCDRRTRCGRLPPSSCDPARPTRRSTAAGASFTGVTGKSWATTRISCTQVSASRSGVLESHRSKDRAGAGARQPMRPNPHASAVPITTRATTSNTTSRLAESR